MSERNPYDGKPYYCQECGAGGSEYYGCEMPDCRLETVETAQARKRKHDKAPPRPETVEVSSAAIAAGIRALSVHSVDVPAVIVTEVFQAMIAARPIAASPAAPDVGVVMPLADVNALDEVVHELGIEDSGTTPTEAVRALRAQLAEAEARIEDLEYRRDYWKRSSDEKAAAIAGIDEHLPTTIAAHAKRIAELEAGLRPFAKAGELFRPKHDPDFDQLIFGPAAGPEYDIVGDDLRRANALLSAPDAPGEASSPATEKGSG